MVQKRTKWFILEPILYGEEMHLREMSKQLNIPHPTLRRYLEGWVKKGVVRKKVKGRQSYFSLNLSHPSIVDIISVVEKERVYLYGEKNLLLRELIFHLHQLDIPIIILFGSAVEDIEHAEDVDLIVVGEINRAKKEEIERKLGLKLHVLELNALEDIGDTLKKEIIKRHLIIEGVEGCVKWMLRN